MIKTVIVEDVALTREALKKDLEDHFQEMEVLGMADGVISGAKLINKEKPDLLLLDIDIKGGTAFDLLEIIPTFKGRVIFITGSESYAIKAFRMAAVDYLMKPVNIEHLKESIERFKEAKEHEEGQLEILKKQLDQSEKSDRIALHTQEEIKVVKLDEIIRCMSSSNYTNFYFRNGEKLIVTKTLKDFELLLGDQGFLRPHQSHLVNKNHIKSFQREDGGYLLMSDKSMVPVSFRKRSTVLAELSDK